MPRPVVHKTFKTPKGYSGRGTSWYACNTYTFGKPSPNKHTDIWDKVTCKKCKRIRMGHKATTKPSFIL